MMLHDYSKIIPYMDEVENNSKDEKKIKDKSIVETIQTYKRNDNDESQIHDLIESLCRLMPINRNDKVKGLQEVISYLDAIINGDPIKQIITYEYETENAKKALDEIIDYIQKHKLASFKQEIESIKDKITKLTNEQTYITRNIEEHEKVRDRLKNEIDELDKQFDSIEEDLESKKQQMQEELEQVKEELEKEIQPLKDEKTQLLQDKEKLQLAVSTLQKELTNYNSQIAGLNNQSNNELTIFSNQVNNSNYQYNVEWVPINENDPIYNTNYLTIDDYIHSLKLTYCEKMHCTMENATNEFEKYCPMLKKLAELVKRCDNKKITAVSSIRKILNFKRWDEEGIAMIALINQMLRDMKMPKYSIVKSNASNLSTSIPTNMNSLLRELHFQKIALEAIAKKQIAERNLQLIIQILKQYIPEDFDLNTLLSIYNIDDNIELPLIENKQLNKTL